MGPNVTGPVQDPLAVLRLDNQLYIQLMTTRLKKKVYIVIGENFKLKLNWHKCADLQVVICGSESALYLVQQPI